VGLVEQPPVDADEDFATAHGVVGRDESIVVTCEQEHVAVRNEHIGFLYLEGYGKVDVGEVSDFYVVLEVKRACGRHESVGVEFGEVGHRQYGLQGGCLAEDGLGIGESQPTQEQRQVYHIFVACFLYAGKTLKIKAF